MIVPVFLGGTELQQIILIWLSSTFSEMLSRASSSKGSDKGIDVPLP